MSENIARATPEQLQTLAAQLIERVDTSDRKVMRIVWSPPTRPFFAAAEGDAPALLWYPQGCLDPGHR